MFYLNYIMIMMCNKKNKKGNYLLTEKDTNKKNINIFFVIKK